jgi:hypothetical protein
VYECLSHKNWGASSSLMHEIARDTFDAERFYIITRLMWEGLENQRPAAWKIVFKALTLLEFLIKNGAERCVDDARNHGHVLRSLGKFNYYEGTVDRGLGVREKTKQVLEILTDDERIREERQKAKQLREKFKGNTSSSTENNRRGGYDGYGNTNTNTSSGGGGGGYGNGGIDSGSAGGGGGGGYSGRYGGSTGSTAATPTFAVMQGEKKKKKKKKKSMTASEPAPAPEPGTFRCFFYLHLSSKLWIQIEFMDSYSLYSCHFRKQKSTCFPLMKHLLQLQLLLLEMMILEPFRQPLLQLLLLLEMMILEPFRQPLLQLLLRETNLMRLELCDQQHKPHSQIHLQLLLLHNSNRLPLMLLVVTTIITIWHQQQ